MSAPDTRLTYLALNTLAERYARHADGFDPDDAVVGLAVSELRVFSQNGEDGVLEEILRRIGPGPNTFVEFGIEGGVEGNCIFLADVMGWRGLFMEPAPEQFALLDAKYSDLEAVQTANIAVTPENVNALINDAGLAANLDVLSIDVDSIDYWIWRALEVTRPRVVVIEYNAHLPNNSVMVQPREPLVAWDGTDYFGASLGAFAALADEKGYHLVHTDLAGVNAFFVCSDFASSFRASPPMRSANFFLEGRGHPRHVGGRTFVDPVTGSKLPSRHEEGA